MGAMAATTFNWKFDKQSIRKPIFTESPKFSLDPSGWENDLCCKMFLRYVNDKNIKFCNLEVKFIESNQNQFGKQFDRNDTYECKIWITLKKREYKASHTCYHEMYSLNKGLEFQCEIPMIYFQETEILEFDPNNRLVISCDINLRPNKLLCLPLVEERSDFVKLLHNPLFSDFTLATKNKEFKVHKNILATRSPVFSRMLSHNMIETKENRVEIIEYNNVVIGELLRYIYTGKVYNLENVVDELFDAARKYELKELQLICLTELCKNISIYNAIELFTLVDSQNAQNLKKYSLDFITRNLNKIISTPEFENLDDLRLLKEIVCHTAKTCF